MTTIKTEKPPVFDWRILPLALAASCMGMAGYIVLGFFGGVITGLVWLVIFLVLYALVGPSALARNYARALRWRMRFRLRPGPGWASALELACHWSRTKAVLRGKRSRPSLPFWARLAMPATEYAVRIGRAQWFRRVWIPTRELCVLLIAPPRTGKTGWLADQILMNPGAVVCTTTRGDLYNLTAALRSRRGPVAVFNPQGVAGLPNTFRWSPIAGCEDPAVAVRRATSFAGVAASGQTGAGDMAFWLSLAASVLAAYFHAAALAGRPITDILQWLNHIDEEAPIEILGTDPRASSELRAALATVADRSSKTAQSITTTATKAMQFLAIPSIKQAVTPAPGMEFNVPEFVRETGTVYLISADATERNPCAPLLAAMVEDIHYQMGLYGSQLDTGKIDPPALYALDELCQVAPVPAADMMADSGGKGMQIIVVAHGWGQLEARYGEASAQAISDTASVRVIFGGITDADHLERVSRICGHLRGGFTEEETAIVPPETVRTLHPSHALVLAGHLSPIVIKARMAWDRRCVRQAGRLALGMPTQPEVGAQVIQLPHPQPEPQEDTGEATA